MATLNVSANFDATYRRYQQRFEAALDRALPPADAWPDVLHEALRYSVFSGGKRLRPVLLLAACDAVGGDSDRALPAACAVEFIHTYSLVHDDLPAMDDDQFRRGRPTTHVVYGEATAILAGDALIAQAFALLSDPSSPLPDATTVNIVYELATAAGSRGLVAGQILDLEAEQGGLAANDDEAATLLETIHRHKTGALFRACLRIGGLIGGAGERELAMLDSYAENFGLAFQIVDDILDVVGDERRTGRPAGSDLRHDKLTFVRRWGVDEARRRAEAVIREAQRCLQPLGARAAFLNDLAAYVVLRDH